MIIDSHADAFQNWAASPGGLPSRELHLKYIQKTLTRPSAKVIGLRDGAFASGALLRTLKAAPTASGTPLRRSCSRMG